VLSAGGAHAALLSAAPAVSALEASGASLADAREELDAVREINRELPADRNRAAR